MTNFENGTINLGTATKGVMLEARYKVISDRIVAGVSPSCGCTTTSFSGKNVVLKYKVAAIPAHLGNMQKISKFAIVKFTDGTAEKIYLNVTVIKG